MRNYYDVLGVPIGASPEEIRRAFRRKAMECHPDRNPGDPTASERFKEAREAYQALSDASKSGSYTSPLKPEEWGEGVPPRPGDRWYRRERGRHVAPYDFQDYSDTAFGESFESIFGTGSFERTFGTESAARVRAAEAVAQAGRARRVRRDLTNQAKGVREIARELQLRRRAGMLPPAIMLAERSLSRYARLLEWCAKNRPDLFTRKDLEALGIPLGRW